MNIEQIARSFCSSFQLHTIDGARSHQWETMRTQAHATQTGSVRISYTVDSFSPIRLSTCRGICVCAVRSTKFIALYFGGLILFHWEKEFSSHFYSFVLLPPTATGNNTDDSNETDNHTHTQSRPNVRSPIERRRKKTYARRHQANFRVREDKRDEKNNNHLVIFDTILANKSVSQSVSCVNGVWYVFCRRTHIYIALPISPFNVHSAYWYVSFSLFTTSTIFCSSKFEDNELPHKTKMWKSETRASNIFIAQINVWHHVKQRLNG